MSKSKNLISRRHAVLPRGLGQFAGDATAASAKGAEIIDADGRALIDFAGGIGVMNVGHCADAVVEAIQKQAATLTHACIHVATYEPYVALAEKLAELLPHGDSTKVMLTNTGAEAVENAIKIARQATGRQGVLCFGDGFHGRSMMAMTLTSKVGYKVGCGPFAPEVYRLPFPNFFRYGDGLSLDAFVDREIKRLQEALLTTVAAEHLAAIIIEPVQGEGGFVPAPKAYLQALRKICDEHKIMLICDEVQSGFCRTARWASYEHAGIIPDISTWAKSMGGGLPIGAVVGKADVMDAARPGTLGGTYGGNPIACAAALATIRTMESLNLNARAEVVGGRVRERFQALQAKCDVVGDVRGIGAMIAIELCFDRDPKKPAAAVVAETIKACLDKGVVVLPASAQGNVIRVLSPLTIEDAALERGLDAIEAALLAAAAKARSKEAV
ncbi:MAG TPA: aspartate aminotransferase family protein [Labilithrix sp.]|nr:aspartate aminotransferase family protein [Labilithrix sp.]